MAKARNYGSLLSYLSVTAAVIDKRGWTSKSAAQDDASKTPTAYIVDNQLFNNQLRDEDRIEVTDGHRELAATVIDWLGTLDADSVNNYEWNLIQLASDGQESYFNLKYAGLAASAIIAYKRTFGLLEDRKAKADPNWRPSKFQGEIKKRQDWDLTVTDIKTLPNYNQHGGPDIKFLYKMIDDDYNVFIWFTTLNVMEDGEQVTIKGTVKDHSEYNGVKQTVLTRCKVLEKETI